MHRGHIRDTVNRLGDDRELELKEEVLRMTARMCMSNQGLAGVTAEMGRVTDLEGNPRILSCTHCTREASQAYESRCEQVSKSEVSWRTQGSHLANMC